MPSPPSLLFLLLLPLSTLSAITESTFNLTQIGPSDSNNYEYGWVDNGFVSRLDVTLNWKVYSYSFSLFNEMVNEPNGGPKMSTPMIRLYSGNGNCSSNYTLRDVDTGTKYTSFLQSPTIEGLMNTQQTPTYFLSSDSTTFATFKLQLSASTLNFDEDPLAVFSEFNLTKCDGSTPDSPLCSEPAVQNIKAGVSNRMNSYLYYIIDGDPPGEMVKLLRMDGSNVQNRAVSPTSLNLTSLGLETTLLSLHQYELDKLVFITTSTSGHTVPKIGLVLSPTNLSLTTTQVYSLPIPESLAISLLADNLNTSRLFTLTNDYATSTSSLTSVYRLCSFYLQFPGLGGVATRQWTIISGDFTFAKSSLVNVNSLRFLALFMPRESGSGNLILIPKDDINYSVVNTTFPITSTTNYIMPGSLQLMNTDLNIQDTYITTGFLQFGFYIQIIAYGGDGMPSASFNSIILRMPNICVLWENIDISQSDRNSRTIYLNMRLLCARILRCGNNMCPVQTKNNQTEINNNQMIKVNNNTVSYEFGENLAPELIGESYVVTLEEDGQPTLRSLKQEEYAVIIDGPKISIEVNTLSPNTTKWTVSIQVVDSARILQSFSSNIARIIGYPIRSSDYMREYT